METIAGTHWRIGRWLALAVVPRGHWRDEAFQLHLAEFLVLEDLACQPVRACGDYDAAWFRQGLQACREVGRLTHDTALVGFAGTD